MISMQSIHTVVESHFKQYLQDHPSTGYGGKLEAQLKEIEYFLAISAGISEDIMLTSLSMGNSQLGKQFNLAGEFFRSDEELHLKLLRAANELNIDLDDYTP